MILTTIAIIPAGIYALVCVARARLAENTRRIDEWALESGATVTRYRGRVTVSHRYYPAITAEDPDISPEPAAIAA